MEGPTGLRCCGALGIPMVTIIHVQRGYTASAVCGMSAGPVLLAASWGATLAQPDESSFVDNPTSDLGADTADVPSPPPSHRQERADRGI